MADPAITVERYGVILNTEHYQACVAFYHEALGLAVLFKKDSPDEKLTCFDMGGAYLMVEPGGQAQTGGKAISQCPVKFRFNVTDVADSAARLTARGVAVEVRQHDWGATAEFFDPDGNRCALRSVAGFGI